MKTAAFLNYLRVTEYREELGVSFLWKPFSGFPLGPIPRDGRPLLAKDADKDNQSFILHSFLSILFYYF